jgi:glycosyl transferase family 25
MINYNNSYNLQIESAYIITIKDNQISEELSHRCAKSCSEVEQPYKIFNAFDGTSGKIVIPDEYKNAPWLKWIKLYTNVLSPTQISCFYSHFALWTKCLELDRPIIILEHDSIVQKKLDYHCAYNSIIYLGSSEQKSESMPIQPLVPPHGTSEDGRHRFICRAHAYSIDPAIAKNLISHVIKFGITTSLDVTIRSDIFPICQVGLYAYDKFEKSTIHKDWKYLEIGL